MVNDIKVLIVDDSMFFREYLSEGLKKQNGIEVVGFAQDPYDARDLILELKPDVITLDVNMPRMSGIDFLKKLIPQYPIPVVVISSASTNIFDALDAGAVDFLKKPDIKDKDGTVFFKELAIKIKISSQVKYINVRKDEKSNFSKGSTDIHDVDKYIIAMGASTGGTEALRDFLSGIPGNLPPILIVQHMPKYFTKAFAERLDTISRAKVLEAENGMKARVGEVYIAPGDEHMLLKTSGNEYLIEIRTGPLVSRHRPSVDVLFRSAARYAGKNVIGIIMTGMGDDGARGMAEMKENGAVTIAQDEASCVVFGMPKEAIKRNCVDFILPLQGILPKLAEILKIQ